jgi:hypothetical protein
MVFSLLKYVQLYLFMYVLIIEISQCTVYSCSTGKEKNLMYLKVGTCRGPHHLGTPRLHAPFSEQDLTRPGRGRNPHHSAQIIRGANIVHNETKAQRRDIGSLHVRKSPK